MSEIIGLVIGLGVTICPIDRGTSVVKTDPMGMYCTTTYNQKYSPDLLFLGINVGHKPIECMVYIQCVKGAHH